MKRYLRKFKDYNDAGMRKMNSATDASKLVNSILETIDQAIDIYGHINREELCESCLAHILQLGI
jgi:hypothetical protein